MGSDRSSADVDVQATGPVLSMVETDAGAETSPRVLVVDDNPKIHEDFRKILAHPRCESESLRELQSALLGKANDADVFASQPTFKVDVASQGQIGVELASRAIREGNSYAVAFVDVRMPPGWDGVETTRRLWDVDDDLHVVLCTAYSDYSWDDLTVRLGASDKLLILKKPFDSVEVRQLARALAEKWRLLRKSRRHAKDLERKVHRRTRELDETNRKLKSEMAERARMEADLQRAQRLETLGVLAAAMRHEINNPLAYVSANLEFVASELEQLTRMSGHHADPYCHLADSMSALREAQVGAERIAQIVRDVTLFSRRERDETRQFDVHDALGRALKVAGNEIRHRAHLVREFSSANRVLGDQARMEQVFVNLLVNAAQAIPEGRVEQNTIRVCTRALPQSDAVQVEIEDTGRGIPADQLQRIFEPFFTTKGPGMGLGLPICQTIVKTVGGEIVVESEVGKGTKLKVTLPVAHGTMEDSPRVCVPVKGDSRPGSSERRLLVVDDSPEILRAIRRGLRSFDLTTAESGRQALDACREGQFDLILCDLMMPDLTGMDVYRELKAHQPGLESRMVFMTGGAFTDGSRDFLDTVPNRIIEKPFAHHELEATLAATLAELDA